ncbi:metallophosphoesterase family protein [Spirochaeta isovalerica]|uniref:Putative phosphodiesterase n=1 Tax=Spirochaeta isovalerica TaxID=150 RepID=A0A841R5P6_9SPIO|nr:metallophosphoesterase family protein [Spirochaeta isovalerica]MBB6480514.1 putative phosphodiesterase [Spirochaeta isovalerica]
MKVLLLSDVHGNSEALEAVLVEPEARECREIWFLGDLAGYGPEPEICYSMLKKRKALIVPGNHDLYFGGRMSSDFFSAEAARALILTNPRVGKEFREVMKHSPLKKRRKGYTLVHGSLINPSSDYILNADDALQNFRLLKGHGLLYGHTHRQGCFLYDRGEILWLRPSSGEVLSFRGKKILINPGSAGQPRDGDPRAPWAVLDTRAKQITFYRSEYDVAAYQRKMQEIGASDFLLSRVEKGL